MNWLKMDDLLGWRCSDVIRIDVVVVGFLFGALKLSQQIAVDGFAVVGFLRRFRYFSAFPKTKPKKSSKSMQYYQTLAIL